MIGSSIAKRYARALFDIAAEDNLYEKYHQELIDFVSLLEGNKDLKEFLFNPIVDQDAKKAVVGTVIGKMDLSKVSANFFRLLVDKQRIGILGEIEVCYRQFMDDALKMVRVRIETAYPLSEGQMDKMKTGLAAATGKTVEMDVAVEESLLGGIVVRIGDTCYDGSIKTQLNNISKLLGEEI
ncbi:MAG: ATP synthase F1 subunit delta [Deltaproteobacteria bacterium]|nr:ATP synthase F1 subunit delta [Deltaproteobacteria bacterium]